MKTGRKKTQKSKPVKKKKSKKPAVKKRVSSFKIKKFAAKKKTGKNIFTVELPKDFKTKQILDLYIENINLKIPKLPNDQVKITLSATHGKEKGGMSYIFDLPKSDKKRNERVIKDAIKHTAADVWKAKPRQEAGYLKHAKIKDYINKITIDFETPD